jgi:hypothetical protein
MYFQHRYSIKHRRKFCEDTGTLVAKTGQKIILRVKMLGRKRWKYIEYNLTDVEKL